MQYLYVVMQLFYLGCNLALLDQIPRRIPVAKLVMTNKSEIKGILTFVELSDIPLYLEKALMKSLSITSRLPTTVKFKWISTNLIRLGFTRFSWENVSIGLKLNTKETLAGPAQGIIFFIKLCHLRETSNIHTIYFFVMNPILSDLAIFCRLGFKN